MMVRNASRCAVLAWCLTLAAAVSAWAEIRVVTEHNQQTGRLAFKSIPAPADNDAATTAEFTLVDGQRDPNGGQLAVLHDGRVPLNNDQPSRNFFFQAGTDGGRIRIDLGRVVSIKEVVTYSWHSSTRGPQVYTLYAAVGTEEGFAPAPKKGTDPATVGWKRIAQVDTRPKQGDGGGQHGVCISDSKGLIGRFRYLLFDILRTEDRDPFGNTFYSEIDVIDADGPPRSTREEKQVSIRFATDDGKYQFVIDATEAPEMVEWSEKTLKPAILQWYPKIVELLSDEGYQPPQKVTLLYRNDMGGTPASAAGGQVNLNARWMQSQMRGEACGAVIHELVHVVQRYPARRGRSAGGPAPGWVVEGIADYIRWFLYEPQTRGAEITARNIASARYDGSYRISANFLDWVVRNYDKDLIRKLNSAARKAQYDEKLWKQWTGKTLEELGEQWKQYHTERIKSSRR